MLENFANHTKEAKPNIRNPYKFWKIRKGNCVDFSEFGAFVANHHGYKVYQVGISYEGIPNEHLITIYIEGGGMSFTDVQYYFDNHGKKFNNSEEIKNLLCASHPGYRIKEYIIHSYENRIIEWSGSNYIN